MTLSHDINPILVAPRPVFAFPLPPPSPTPPRSGALPSDALEEFLSILKSRRTVRPRQDNPEKHDSDSQNRWVQCGVLSSPVSRMHTRNPFLKHATEAPAPPLSPAAIPLPTPSPGELLELF
ncbi:hypothetical protein MD484_g3552, partial [Candolleomyces efflorescens]